MAPVLLLLAAVALLGPTAGARAHGPIGVAGDAVCGAAGGTGSTVGNTTCLLRATEIIYVTNWGPDGQPPMRRTQTLSVVNVPTPIDVDNRAGADLVATVRALSTTRIALEVTKVLGASSSLPVSIVAHANDPADTSVRYVFGYDARHATAPGRFLKTLALRDDGIDFSVSTSNPGTSLALLGSVIQLPTTNPVTGKQEESLAEMRATLTPVPNSTDGVVSLAKQSGTETVEAQVTVNLATKVVLDFASEEAATDALKQREGTHTDLHGTLDRVAPASLPARSAVVKLVRSPVPRADPPGTKRIEVTTATAGTPAADGGVTITERPVSDPAKITSKTDVAFEDLPSSSKVTVIPKRSADNTTNPPTPAAPLVIDVRTAAGESFTLVDAAHAENGEPKRLTHDQYAYVETDAARAFSTAAARVRGLHRATIQVLRERLVDVDAVSSGGRFHVLAKENPGVQVDADIQNLPRSAELTLKPKSTPTLRYEGSAPIGTATINVHDDSGVARGERTGERANDLKVEVTGLPAGPITANLDPGAKNIELDARDGSNCTNPADRSTCALAQIGEVEAQLWTRPRGAPDDKLPVGPDQAFVDTLDRTGSDGVFVRDVAGSPSGFGDPDRYVVFARLSQLKAATIVLDQASPDVKLETGSRPDLRVDLENNAVPQCNDGEDNDGDGKEDFPDDTECITQYDDSETTTPTGMPRERISATVKNRPRCLRFGLGKQRVAPSSCSSSLGALNLPSPTPTAGATTILYEGGDGAGAAQTNPKPDIDLTAKGLQELKGQELLLTLKGLPGRFEAVLIDEEVIDLGTLPAADDLDVLEVRLRSGNVNAADVLPQGVDGVLIRKNKITSTVPFAFDRNVTYVRISDLRSAHVTTKPGRDPNRNDLVAEVDTVPQPGRGFVFDSEEDDVRAIPTAPFIQRITRETDASLAQVRPKLELKVKVSDRTLPQQISYRHDANAGTAGKLTFDRKTVDANGAVLDEKTHVDADPVPSRIDFCVHGSGPACGLDAFSGNPVAKHPARFVDGPHPTGQTIVLDASGQLTVNFSACLAPSAQGSCSSPSSFLEVTKAKAQLLRLQISSIDLRFFCTTGGLCTDAPPNTQQPPQTLVVTDSRMLLFVDTDNRTVSMGADPSDPSKGFGLDLKLLSPPAKFERLKGFLPEVDPKGRLEAQDRSVRVRKDAVPVQDASFAGAPAFQGSVLCPDKFQLFIDANFLLFIDADLVGVICRNPNRSP